MCISGTTDVEREVAAVEPPSGLGNFALLTLGLPPLDAGIAPTGNLGRDTGVDPDLSFSFPFSTAALCTCAAAADDA